MTGVRSIRVGAAVALWISLSHPAWAEADSVLSWRAPAECPTEDSVIAEVERWLREPSSVPVLRALHVVATVRKASEDPPGWRLELTFHSPEGEEHQTLVAERCDTLADIVALDIALAVDPTLMGDGRAGAGRDGARRWRFGVRGAGGVAAGTLPQIAPMVSLAGVVTRALLRLELGGQYLPSRTARYDEPADVGARIDLLTAFAHVCVAPHLGDVELPLCAGVQMGDLRARGFGVADTETAHRPYAEVTLGPAAAVSLLPWLYAGIGAEGAFAVARPSFHMRNLGELYRPALFSGRAWAGLEIRFR